MAFKGVSLESCVYKTMRAAKIAVIFGFVAGVIGWLLAAIFDARELGKNIFFVAFYIAAAGVVATQLMFRFPDEERGSGVGLKIGAIGFAICCISGLFVLLSDQEVIAGVLFKVGFLIGVAGIMIIFLNVAKK